MSNEKIEKAKAEHKSAGPFKNAKEVIESPTFNKVHKAIRESGRGRSTSDGYMTGGVQKNVSRLKGSLTKYAKKNIPSYEEVKSNSKLKAINKDEIKRSEKREQARSELKEKYKK